MPVAANTSLRVSEEDAEVVAGYDVHHVFTPGNPASQWMRFGS